MNALQRWPFYTEPSLLDVRGLSTAYRRKGDGVPLLYLHGSSLTRRWLPFYEELSKSVDLIAPEHPGYGDTPFPDWLDNFSDVVLHYAEFLDKLKLGRIHLVGHGFGGWIAAEIASYYPERLASLQLISPAGLKDAFLHDIFRETPEEVLDRTFNGKPERYQDYVEVGDPVEGLVHAYTESMALARLAWQPRYDRKLERRLGRVSAPTQVILPEEDRVISTDAARRYAELISGATVAQITNPGDPTSHVAFVQAPAHLAQMISAFALSNTKG